APRIKVPTLVLHARNDAAIPFEEGRLLATLIPGARFVPLNSKNHILLEEEPAWDRFLAEVHTFLGNSTTESGSGKPGEVFPELTPREREVLGLVAKGFENDEIAKELFISSKTVRNHITHIFSKLKINSRPKAIVLAREAGMGIE
ncbi:MAG: LuxR C-terminal-related transcriptional regulator, partial [Candidatus Halalkalibacterium sp. M3_1C_030]